MSNTTSVVGRRVLGLVFFLVLALFLVFTIGMFNKTFTKVVKIDLLTDTAGNALPPNADVKVRGSSSVRCARRPPRRAKSPWLSRSSRTRRR